MKINIIKADPAHLSDCCSALENSELGRIYFSEAGSADRALQEGFSKEEIYVAVNETSDCLGFIWFQLKGAFHSFAYLHIIAVREAFRGMGVGKKLLSHFEKTAAGSSSKLFLVVADFNPKARKLYESIGYREVGLLPDLYRTNINEHLMMKVL